MAGCGFVLAESSCCCVSCHLWFSIMLSLPVVFCGAVLTILRFFSCALVWFCLGYSFLFISVLLSELWLSVFRFLTQKHSKMVPKSSQKELQNRCWRGSGGHLGALLDKRLPQNIILNDFGTPLAPNRRPTGPKRAPRWSQDGQLGAKKEPRWPPDSQRCANISQDTPT